VCNKYENICSIFSVIYSQLCAWVKRRRKRKKVSLRVRLLKEFQDLFVLLRHTVFLSKVILFYYSSRFLNRLLLFFQ